MKIIVKIVLSTGKAGILIRIMLTMARISGETVPLLFTSLNNNLYPIGKVIEPTVATLLTQIFACAITKGKYGR